MTDLADKKVPADKQVSFADAMRRAGRPITEFFVEATDPEHHGTTAFSRIVTAGCVLGKKDREIASELDVLSKRNAEINRRQLTEIAQGSTSRTDGQTKR